MGDRIDKFEKFRADMNDRILGTGTTETKRFFALDSRVYEDGALSTKDGARGSLSALADLSFAGRADSLAG